MSSEDFYSFSVKQSNGEMFPLSKWQGKTVLVVNVASKCGYTGQYKGLEELYQKYKDQGLIVVGFPCNQFGGQEPGTDQEIQSFCDLTYKVTFPVMAKIAVNGENTDPLYQWLKSSAPGLLGTEVIKWNFTKFLVDGEGNVVERYAPQTEPKDIAADIETTLKA
jgi:glutathione peroxidase